PRGIIPLRSFFTTAYATTQGEEISAKTVKAMVKKIVERENKKKPLSDQKISETIKDEGVECARRTVAKYRYELSIASASQRKNYC
ncbi:MAG: RNA polymerase sigma-54 factor, partial [Waddliaceae bacterium]|nr:RNA polymerase sigma-54 factor [Waddliaceae bacterium]